MKEKLKKLHPKKLLATWKKVFSKESLQAALTGTNVKQGSYRGSLTILVIAIIVVINLIAASLPSSINTIDLSEEEILSVSKTSKKVLNKIDDKIQLIVLADKQETTGTVQSFLEKYAASSKTLSIEWVDPVLHPSTLTKYDAEENTVVVLNETTGDYQKVLFSDILTTSYDSSYNTVSVFDGDAQLTSTIHGLTNQEKHLAVTTTGHGEEVMSTSTTNLLGKSGFTTEDLNTLIAKEIPEGAETILINGPTTDFTDEEIATLKEFIAGGGKITLLLGDTKEQLPKLYEFMKEYGITQTSGYVADTERSYQGQAYYLFPNVIASDEYLEGMETGMILIPNTKGLVLSEPENEKITVDGLLETSENGYNVTEDNEEQGIFSLAAVAKQVETSDDESGEDSESTTGTLTVFASSNVINDEVLSAYPTLENNTFLVNAVLAGFDDVENLSIESKTLQSNRNTVVSAGGYSLLFMIVIPLAILASGFVTWLRRRKA